MSLGRVLDKSNFFNLHSKKANIWKQISGSAHVGDGYDTVFSVHKTVWCIFIHVHKVFYIISSVREKLRSQNHINF